MNARMIESYSFGNITIDGKRYTSDVIIYPERVDDKWWRRQGHNLAAEDLEQVLRYHPEVLVIGRGKPGLMKVSDELAAKLRGLGIDVFVAPTAKAVRIYNEQCPQRKTIAALHLSC